MSCGIQTDLDSVYLMRGNYEREHKENGRADHHFRADGGVLRNLFWISDHTGHRYLEIFAGHLPLGIYRNYRESVHRKNTGNQER
jgi:hypothetical protein